MQSFVINFPSCSFECASSAQLQPLEGISASLAQSARNLNTGACTCMAVSRRIRSQQDAHMTFIAIGTANGHILLYNGMRQTLRHTINAHARKATTREENGACTSLSFAPNGLKLVAGFARGAVQLIDVSRGVVLRTIPSDEAHQVGHGVLQVNRSMFVRAENASLFRSTTLII